MTVLLLGADGVAGNNYAKCLRRGNPHLNIIGTGTNLDQLKASRQEVLSSSLLLDKDISDEDKLHKIRELVANNDVKFIHAQPDKEVRWLFEKVDYFSDKMTWGSTHTWDKFSDKAMCTLTWEDQLGVSFHHAIATACTQEVFDFIKGDSDQVWVRARTGAGSKAALPVGTFDQASAWIEYWTQHRGMSVDDFVISEFLPGSEYAVQLFYLYGKLVHSQARERLEYVFGNQMPSGQSSSPSIARTVSDLSVYETADKAVRIIDENRESMTPHGIYGVDMKTSKRGELVPTEVNYGRYYTTSNFFANMGVNTPYEEMMYVTSGEQMTERVNSLRPDVKWVRAMDRGPVLL